MIYRSICDFSSCVNMRFSRLIKRSFSVSSQTVFDKASKDGELRVFIVAGEVSGDSIAARFMTSLKNLSPFPVHFAGVGGFMMSKQGLNSLFPMEDIAVMGIWELLPHLYKFRVRLKQTINAALSLQPHVVLTVDAKGFSFRFLNQLQARYGQQGLIGPPHFHYVAPSFWAWKGGEARLERLSGFVDHVLCILPFEADICRLHGLAATFVGHPTLEDVLDLKVKDHEGKKLMVQGNEEEFRSEYGISSGATIISVLPGSRLQEVTRMLSMFSDAMQLLKSSFPDLVTVVHVASNRHVEDYVARATCDWPTRALLVPGGSSRVKYNSFSASRVALCTSGTVAVEMQLARLPCVVAYRAHFLTEWIIRYKAKVPYISLPNILLDSAVIPEALFQACTPSMLASMLMELLRDEALRQKQILAADKIMELLTPPVGGLIQTETSPAFLGQKTPSMVAASTVLHFQRT